MKIAVTICRVLMGLGFTVFGANILFPFLPQPPMVEGSLPAQFMGVMGPSHWLQVVGAFQLIGGLLLLVGGTAPLGLCLLAPVLVNVILFHTLLENGAGLLPGLVFSALEIFLLYAYRAYFTPLFTTHAKPKV